MTTTASKPAVTERTQPQRGAAPQVQPGVRIDPLRVLRQNQGKLILAAILGVAIGGAAKLVFDEVYPLYSGTVLFELRTAITKSDELGREDTRSEEAVERMGQTEAARLLSRGVLERAMLSRDIATTQWSKQFEDENGVFIADKAVADLEEKLSASHRRRTQYFQLNWSTHVPSDIPIVLNSIAETYLATRKAQDDERFAANLKIFNSRLTETEKDLTSVSQEIAQFIQEKGITSLRDVASDIVQAMEDTSRRMNEAKGQLSMASSRKKQTQAKLDGRLEPNSDDMRQAFEDPILMRLNGTVKDLRVSADAAMSKFGPSHQEFKRAESIMAAAEAERDRETKNILNRNLTADFKVLSDQEQSLAGVLKVYEADYARLETRLKEFTAAAADLEQKRDRQARLQEQRSKNLDLVNELESLKLREDARSVMVAQRAVEPREKSFPRWSVMIPLGGLLFIVMMLAWVFLRELLDQRVRYASDLAGMPARLLGVVPDLEEDPTGAKRLENAIREAPQSVTAEMLRQTASNLQKHLRGNHIALMAMGGLPSAGVTAILTNIAFSMASSGRKVLLVDANFRKPGLAAALGQDSGRPGLGEILGGKLAFDDSVAHVGERIDLINAGAPEQRVFERLATVALDEFLAAAKSRYDVVLIDAPPAIVAGDAMVLASRVDATLLVVRAFQEHRGLVSRLIGQLSDMPSQFVGVVLNRPRHSAGGYFRKNFETMASYAQAGK